MFRSASKGPGPEVQVQVHAMLSHFTQQQTADFTVPVKSNETRILALNFQSGCISSPYSFLGSLPDLYGDLMTV